MRLDALFGDLRTADFLGCFMWGEWLGLGFDRDFFVSLKQGFLRDRGFGKESGNPPLGSAVSPRPHLPNGRAKQPRGADSWINAMEDELAPDVPTTTKKRRGLSMKSHARF